MWISLGENELINLNHVSSLRKGIKDTIEIQFGDFRHGKTLSFEDPESRDAAFRRLSENLSRLGELME